MNKIRNKLLALLLPLLLVHQARAQTVVTIGNGTNINWPFSYPAPYGNNFWGSKHQMLIRAAELTAQGMTAGSITALAFNVATPEGTPLTNFTIGMKLTAALAVTSAFETGFTTVWGPQTYTETSGWNTHTFATPFYWDGTSSLDRKSTRLNSSHIQKSRMPSSA